MAKRKSPAQKLAQHLIDTQKRKAADKAALEKKELEARLRAEAAAVKQQAVLERQAQRAAEDLQRRQQAADARAVQKAIRDLDKRDAQRVAEEARAAKERERKAAEEERLAKVRALQQLKDEALEHTRAVEATIDSIGRILAERDRGLQDFRRDTDAAFSQGDANEYADCVAGILSEPTFLSRSRTPPKVAYAPENRRLTLVIDLPRKERVPVARGFRYVAARREIVAEPRKPAEIQQIYQDAIARFTLCVADYAAAVTSPYFVETIAVNGHVRTKDPATGQPVNPCLVTFLTEREQFEQLLLDEPELDPVRCLHSLKALVSPNPFDLEPVTPMVNFDLEQYKLVGEAGALSGLDSRTDLLKMSPYAFEQLIRRLFEAMGFSAWNTPPSRDDGVDAVAVRDDIAIGGVCVIQAKRYKGTVPIESVRALYGTMQQKKAYTGLLVTTSSFGPQSYAFAADVGRITLIEGKHLKSLLQEHLGMDVLISAPQRAGRSALSETNATAPAAADSTAGSDGGGSASGFDQRVEEG